MNQQFLTDLTTYTWSHTLTATPTKDTIVLHFTSNGEVKVMRNGDEIYTAQYNFDQGMISFTNPQSTLTETSEDVSVHNQLKAIFSEMPTTTSIITKYNDDDDEDEEIKAIELLISNRTFLGDLKK